MAKIRPSSGIPIYENLQITNNPSSKSAVGVEGDSVTVYSAATTTVPNIVQELIVWVCDDIYNSLWLQVDCAGYKAIAGILPRLVKAFAIHLGNIGSNSLSLQIMHFIYKHHREIIAQLNARFDHEDDTLAGSRGTDDGMTLHEKILLWESKIFYEKRDIDTEVHDRFQGVEDDIDDDGDDLDMAPPLPAYSNAIINSSAYNWFLESLSKLSSLQWGPSEDIITAKEIRETILQQIPTGKISKNLPPRTFSAHFRIVWGPLQTRFDEESARVPESSAILLSAITTLTSSSDNEIQTTTIGQYFEQTWPNGRVVILRCLQELLSGAFSDKPITVRAADGATISFSLQEPLLRVNVSGPAYSIAQYGEQLAWITASLQPLGNPDLSEDCCLFREYCRSRGPEILAQVVADSNNPAIIILGESDALQQVLSQGLEMLLESWNHPRLSSVEAETEIEESGAGASGMFGDSSDPETANVTAPTGAYPDSRGRLLTQILENPGLLSQVQSMTTVPVADLDGLSGTDAVATQSLPQSSTNNLTTHGDNSNQSVEFLSSDLGELDWIDPDWIWDLQA
ncbi:hypothetical protein GQ53DRAFT_819962 [Thozetella sp. PMI_491]|nr:hypothetical protein GQ53DRAFT_819962 [Thozetella sp. PMI_491]